MPSLILVAPSLVIGGRCGAVDNELHCPQQQSHQPSSCHGVLHLARPAAQGASHRRGESGKQSGEKGTSSVDVVKCNNTTICIAHTHLQMESKLHDHPCKKAGIMLEAEFAEAMDNLVPLVPDTLCKRLFMQGLAQVQEAGQGRRETLPTRRLACIL